MENSKSLVIIQDDNDENIIHFYLLVKNEKFNWNAIKKIDFIKYDGWGIIENNASFEKENYHHLIFKFNNIKYDFLKQNIKNFIEEMFSTNVDDEKEFVELINELINFFNNTKQRNIEVIVKNYFCYLIFLYQCWKFNIIDSVLRNPDFEQALTCNGELSLKDNVILSVQDYNSLNFSYSDNNNLKRDYIAVKFSRGLNKGVNIFELIQILEENTSPTYFENIKSELESFDQEKIKKITISSLEDFDLYYYNHKDGPELEIINLNKCYEITYKQEESLVLKNDYEKFEKLLKNLFNYLN